MASTRTYSHLRKIDNLQEYIADKAARMEAGWINGKVYFRNKYYSEAEFDLMFPAKIIYAVIQLDGSQIRTN